MAKNMNKRGKHSHTKNEDRSKYWKYGKSSGNPEATKRKAERKANKNKKD